MKAVGGDLHSLRLALTGRDRGPELAAVVAALDRDETLRRLDAAL
jgi:lysyl-tRNA synthetase class I